MTDPRQSEPDGNFWKGLTLGLFLAVPLWIPVGWTLYDLTRRVF